MAGTVFGIPILYKILGLYIKWY